MSSVSLPVLHIYSDTSTIRCNTSVVSTSLHIVVQHLPAAVRQWNRRLLLCVFILVTRVTRQACKSDIALLEGGLRRRQPGTFVSFSQEIRTRCTFLVKKNEVFRPAGGNMRCHVRNRVTRVRYRSSAHKLRGRFQTRRLPGQTARCASRRVG